MNPSAAAPGYTTTDAGVIPQDWQALPLADFCSTYSGGTPSTSRSDYYGGDIPWIASGDLNQGIIEDVNGRITAAGLQNSSAKLVEANTLLMALYGATAGIPAITKISGAINQAVLAIKPRGADPEYLYAWLAHNKNRIIDTYTQGGQPNLSGEIVRKIVVPLPEKTEQRQISSHLSDVTSLISALERLITKKQSIKHGMIQELLTGKTRLPGFTKQWEDVLLGQHVTYVKTIALSRAQLDEESPCRYLHYGDIHTTRDIRLAAAIRDMPRAAAPLVGAAGFLKVGDLVFADASEDPAGVGKSIEVTSVPAEGVVPGLHTIAARFDKKVLADGFKAYLQFIPDLRNSLLRLAAGTKVLATTRSYISSITLHLPDVEEQTAIAQILHDVDDEIDALQHRLLKARAMKQGVMQELLTGRTRLQPVSESSL